MKEDRLRKLFEDKETVEKIKRKLPYLFWIAERMVSRGGKSGMEVGTLREQIIIALLIYKFGWEDVKIDIPPNEKEIDVIIEGHKNPISIKTKKGSGFSGIKLIWTVDWKQVSEFYKSYYPKTDMLFVNVIWNKTGVFAYIPLEVQEEVFKSLGRERYIKLPRKGTNPRGVEISSQAFELCLEHPFTCKIPINWKIKREFEAFNPYERWVELWERD
jgi:hypothetical protein